MDRGACWAINWACTHKVHNIYGQVTKVGYKTAGKLFSHVLKILIYMHICIEKLE